MKKETIKKIKEFNKIEIEQYCESCGHLNQTKIYISSLPFIICENCQEELITCNDCETNHHKCIDCKNGSKFTI